MNRRNLMELSRDARYFWVSTQKWGFYRIGEWKRKQVNKDGHGSLIGIAVRWVIVAGRLAIIFIRNPREVKKWGG